MSYLDPTKLVPTVFLPQTLMILPNCKVCSELEERKEKFKDRLEKELIRIKVRSTFEYLLANFQSSLFSAFL